MKTNQTATRNPGSLDALVRRLDLTNKALDELHIVCETSKPEIFNWYLTDRLAAEARKNAIDRLLANRDAESANVKVFRE